MTGAPGRTRTSTMLPLPDFESGASTNSATGAGGRDHSREARGVNGPASVELVPRPSERPSSAMRHKFARERDPGPRAPGHALAFAPRSLVRSCGSGGLAEFILGPRVARTRGLARDTRRQRVARRDLPRHPPHHRIRAR
jgi:hypothetical protein